MTKVLKLASIKLDLRAQSDGEWRSVPDWQGVRLKCRSLDYGPFMQARAGVLERLARRYDPDPAPDDVWQKELGLLLAEHILLQWDGFEIRYDEDLAREMLEDPAWRPLRQKVLAVAAQIGKQELEFVEAAEKNSVASSAIN